MNRGRALAPAAAALLLVLPPAALAKDGFEARLDAALPADASPGDELSVGWTLAGTEPGEPARFSAMGVFVRLVGDSASEAVGKEGPTGHYTAVVRVPEGGIAGVEIGVQGTRCVQDKPCERSDYLFPIAGDPLARGAGGAAGAPAERPWPALLLGVGAALGLVLLVARARPRIAA